MKRYVFDASAVARVFFRSGEPPPVVEFKVSPAFMAVEFGNVLWKYLRSGHLTVHEVLEVWRSFQALGFEYHEDGPLIPDALRFGAKHGLTAYDALYAVLARDKKAVLITADKELASKAESAGISVRFLAPLRSPAT